MMAAAGNHARLPPADVTAARAHFIANVRADGCRRRCGIGRQPYGLLPVTSLAGWPQATQPDHAERLATLLRSLRDRLFRSAASTLLRLSPGQADLDRRSATCWRSSRMRGGSPGARYCAQYLRTLLGLMRIPPTTPASESALLFFPRLAAG